MLFMQALFVLDMSNVAKPSRATSSSTDILELVASGKNYEVQVRFFLRGFQIFQGMLWGLFQGFQRVCFRGLQIFQGMLWRERLRVFSGCSGVTGFRP